MKSYNYYIVKYLKNVVKLTLLFALIFILFKVWEFVADIFINILLSVFRVKKKSIKSESYMFLMDFIEYNNNINKDV